MTSSSPGYWASGLVIKVFTIAWGGVPDGDCCATAVVAAAISNEASRILTVCMDVSGGSIVGGKSLGNLLSRHSGEGRFAIRGWRAKAEVPQLCDWKRRHGRARPVGVAPDPSCCFADTNVPRR